MAVAYTTLQRSHTLRGLLFAKQPRHYVSLLVPGETWAAGVVSPSDNSAENNQTNRVQRYHQVLRGGLALDSAVLI